MEIIADLWDAFWAIPHIKAWLTAAWLLYIIPLCAWIMLQKREPVATLSWLMSLAMLPYLGYLIYFLFGPQRIKRRTLQRHRARRGLDADDMLHRRGSSATELATLAQATSGQPPSSATAMQLLVDGAETYRAILEAVAQARDHIHLEYYIFTADTTGTRLRDALAERAAAGVKVRLLLDAVGCTGLRRHFLQPLVDAGGQFCWFHPTRFKLFTRPWLNLRTHRKIIVIDGQVAFTGGINITDEEDESLRDDAYRDLHMQLHGPVVACLQQVFVEDWVYASGHGRADFEGTTLWPEATEAEQGGISAQVLTSGPDTPWEPIHRMHVAAIHEATRRVWLVTPYFVPGEAARMALTSAALGGVDVRLLVPKLSDSRLVTYAARSYFDELLAAGVKVYEYGPRLMHSKAMLCDDDVSLLGSANFDHRSFRLNFEVCVLFRDNGVSSVLGDWMRGEFERAQPVQNLRERSLWRHRLPEAMARLMSPLL
ncbi:cardiolipin synthase [Pseudoxanthomonas dokdonensis]|uniref:Cardiolipin synthase n=1 Tax=Pseudoxanthomonas dokdonensis TaxID=344882 RepID=A0A0R0D3Z1_9GAMM|nr:cardiolipin synthase [Pseudoxanthomonas dokdonensis]KRG72040.1 cardiolipin synthetase [Pseudoxanthomonas dokdonensis]